GMARNKSDDRKQAMSQAYLALALQRRGKLKEADSNAREAQALLSANKDSLNPETVRATHALAELRQAQKKYEEADKFYKIALTLAKNEKVFGEQHPVVGQILCNQATLLDAQGKYGPAEGLYKEGIPMVEA